MPMGNVENLPPCAEIGDPYGGATDSLCPVPGHRKGHVLHVIVGEKDTFQVVEDDLDSPVGGVPDFCVIAAPRRGDVDFHHGLLKARERPPLRCLPKGGVHHVYPVFLHRRRQFLLGGHGFPDREHDSVSTYFPTAHLRDKSFVSLPGCPFKVLPVPQYRQYLAPQPQDRIVCLPQFLSRRLSALRQALLNVPQGLS